MYCRSLPLSSDPAALYARLSRSGSPWAVLDSGWDPAGTRVGPLSRFCVCAVDPFALLTARGDRAVLTWKDGRCERGSTLSLLRDVLQRFRLPDSKWPTPFPAGAMGYFGYELGALMDPAIGAPPRSDEKTGLPDLWLGLFDSAVTIDQARERVLLTATGQPHTGDRARRRAQSRIRELTAAVESAAAGPIRDPIPAPSPSVAGDGFESNFTPAGFARAVNRIKEFISAGDIYQANLSQRFRTRYEGDPFRLFLGLRQTAPAPFSAFLDGGGFTVVSMSPERFLHLDPETRRIETRPIKGTRPRGRTAAEDRHLARELVHSGKDRAEHVMIVDLERNDLGRVARVGTVQVRELSLLETFPTLFHLTSTVEGTLAPGRDRVDLLKATFPGGSITGAPKIRAMQVIDELETVRRGIYTGSLGYLSFTGGMDLNVAIRTIVVRDGRAEFHVGAGIVADSDPEGEYQETLLKGRSLREALEAAEKPHPVPPRRSAVRLLADRIF